MNNWREKRKSKNLPKEKPAPTSAAPFPLLLLSSSSSSSCLSLSLSACFWHCKVGGFGVPMATFDHFGNMYDVALKPRLLRTLISDHLQRPFSNPSVLSKVVSLIWVRNRSHSPQSYWSLEIRCWFMGRHHFAPPFKQYGEFYSLH